MNLLKFARLHRGLRAAAFDWIHEFGEDYRKTLSTLDFAEDGVASAIQDIKHPGEWCELSLESLFYLNPKRAAYPKQLPDRKLATAWSVSPKSFAKEIARAVIGNAQGVRIEGKADSGLVSLATTPGHIFFSLATKIYQLQQHIDLVENRADKMVLLTLFDFSHLLGKLSFPDSLSIECITAYIDEEEDSGLHQKNNVLAVYGFERRVHRDGLLCVKPANASWENLHVVIHTKDDYLGVPKNAYRFELLECWFVDPETGFECEHTRIKATEIKDFLSDEKSKTLNVAWEYLRTLAFYSNRNERVPVPPRSEAAAMTQRRGDVKTILATKFGLPRDGALQSSAKGTCPNFHLSMVYLSESMEQYWRTEEYNDSREYISLS